MNLRRLLGVVFLLSFCLTLLPIFIPKTFHGMTLLHILFNS